MCYNYFKYIGNQIMTRHYRPREKSNRTNRINVRLNDAEYARILRAASKTGLPPTSWAADVLINESAPKNK